MYTTETSEWNYKQKLNEKVSRDKKKSTGTSKWCNLKIIIENGNLVLHVITTEIKLNTSKNK